EDVLHRAKIGAAILPETQAYPDGADSETQTFIDYWFDSVNRVQLTSLAKVISRLRDPAMREIMWCAFSRLIITKKSGVSLAMDVSHSRPHKTYTNAPIKAFDHFQKSVTYIVKKAPFNTDSEDAPTASVQNADARQLPIEDASVDMVITSPPYLNAIDYLRGHKLSLVWMGHSIKEIRELRATNVGTEVIMPADENEKEAALVMQAMCDPEKLSKRHIGMLRQYIYDLRSLLSETKRVLRVEGKAVYVVGNCNLRDTFIENSKGIEVLAQQLGLEIRAIRRRPLPENRRYLPPPQALSSGVALSKRMREEVILTLIRN
ncbi:MAG TPA: hypothetical protein VGB77_14860, partial [Abditibacteriaceae bacterium]